MTVGDDRVRTKQRGGLVPISVNSTTTQISTEYSLNVIFRSILHHAKSIFTVKDVWCKLLISLSFLNGNNLLF